MTDFTHFDPALGQNGTASGRCRLCTANDRGALIEHVAEYTWNSRIERMVEDIPWSDAEPTWQAAFREYAIAAVQAMEG